MQSSSPTKIITQLWAAVEQGDTVAFNRLLKLALEKNYLQIKDVQNIKHPGTGDTFFALRCA